MQDLQAMGVRLKLALPVLFPVPVWRLDPCLYLFKIVDGST